MAITAPNTPGGGQVPVTKPDATAAQQGGSGEDRAGFDLGGASDREQGSRDGSAPMGSGISPGGPIDPQPASSDATGHARASGMSEGASRTPGGPAGGAKPGEADTATAGAVRPPQTTSADQTFTQGNPDDAA